MHKIHRIISFVNPYVLYVPILYCIIKVFETWLRVESILQICWDRTRGILGDNMAVYAVGAFNVYSFVFYWMLVLIFEALKTFKIPKEIERLRIQAKMSEMEKPENFSKIIKTTLRNQFVTLVTLTVFYMYDNDFARIKISSELPSFFIVMRDLIGCCIIHEIVFYYSHRSLHSKWLYRIHKKHHEFQTTTCLATQYCSVLEQIFGNLIPSVIGIRILETHITTALLWVSIMLTTITYAHCGYHLPFIHSPQFHDYHHLKYNVNFSVHGIADKLHGTFGHFETSKNYENHRIIFSSKVTKSSD